MMPVSRRLHFERAVLVKDPLEAVLVIAGLAGVERAPGRARARVSPPCFHAIAGLALVQRRRRRESRAAGRIRPPPSRRRPCSSAGNRRPAGASSRECPARARRRRRCCGRTRRRPGSPYGHGHFRERPAVHHRTHAAAVFIPDACTARGLRADAARSGNATSPSGPRRPRCGSRDPAAS